MQLVKNYMTFLRDKHVMLSFLLVVESFFGCNSFTRKHL